jgi:hypothetical protein
MANRGVSVAYGSSLSGGSGGITLTGTGGGGTRWNEGVILYQAAVTSVGNINLSGTGGGGLYSHGIAIYYTSFTGPFGIASGSASGSNSGIYVFRSPDAAGLPGATVV